MAPTAAILGPARVLGEADLVFVAAWAAAVGLGLWVAGVRWLLGRVGRKGPASRG